MTIENACPGAGGLAGAGAMKPGAMWMTWQRSAATPRSIALRRPRSEMNRVNRAAATFGTIPGVAPERSTVKGFESGDEAFLQTREIIVEADEIDHGGGRCQTWRLWRKKRKASAIAMPSKGHFDQVMA